MYLIVEYIPQYILIQFVFLYRRYFLRKLSDLHENGCKVNAVPPKTKAKLLTGFLFWF